MAVRLLRAIYAIEFLVTLIAALSLWREVGGQYHLDLMPWYLKLILTLALAGAVTQITVNSVNENRRGVFVWSVVIAAILLASGLVTYHYHLNEPSDEDQDAATLSASAKAKHLNLLFTSSS